MAGIADRQRKIGYNSRSKLTGPLKSSNDMRKSPEWTRIKEIVLQRDNYTCCRCGNHNKPDAPTNIQLTVDHIVAVASGGLNLMSNLETLCADCHSKKLGKKNQRAAGLLRSMQTRKTKQFGR